MPLNFHYLEAGVVHVQWLNKVTIEELEGAIAQIRARIDEQGDAYYVEIVDLLECTQIPFDLRGLRRIGTYDPRIVGYVVLKPSTLAKTMANMLSQVAGLSFRMTSTLEEAITTSKVMLEENSKIKN